VTGSGKHTSKLFLKILIRSLDFYSFNGYNTQLKKKELAHMTMNLHFDPDTLVYTTSDLDIGKKYGWLFDKPSNTYSTTNPLEVSRAYEDKAKDILEVAKGLYRTRRFASAAILPSTKTEWPIPAGKSLYEYQKAGIEFILATPNTLLADEMGVGKTIQAIVATNVLGGKTLVICPASLKINWSREFASWSVPEKRVAIISGEKGWDASADVTIINYDILHRNGKGLKSQEWETVICDECHYLQNPKTKRTKAAMRVKSANTIMITGTPITSRPINMLPVLKRLDKAGWHHYPKFVYRYCAAVNTRFGLDVSGSSNEVELSKRLRSTVMIRRKKDEVLKELPPKVKQVIELGAGRKGDKELLKVLGITDPENLSEADYRKLMKFQQGQGAEFSEMSTIRKENAISKLKEAVPFIKDAVVNSGKVVVFAHHKEVVHGIAGQFGEGEVVTITGDTSMTKRQEAVDRFQTDPAVGLFVGNIQAAGVGLTLTASSHVIFAELDWVPGNMDQASDRCHRIGAVGDSVLIQYLVLGGSIDAAMAKALAAKADTIDSVLDDVWLSECFQ